MLFDKELEEIEKAPVVLSFIQNDRGRYEKRGQAKIHPLVHYRIRCETWDHILQREQNSSSTGAVLFISFDTH